MMLKYKVVNELRDIRRGGKDFDIGPETEKYSQMQ